MKLPHDIRYMTLFEACFKTSIPLPSLMAFTHVSVVNNSRMKTPIISAEVHVSIMSYLNEVIERQGSTSSMIRFLRAPERDLELGMPNEERNRQRNANYNRRISISNQCIIGTLTSPSNPH